MNGESFLNSCSQKNTWFTNKIVLRDLTSWFYCFPSIYELNPSNKMWALGTHNFFLKINFMCPSCEMVQLRDSFFSYKSLWGISCFTWKRIWYRYIQAIKLSGLACTCQLETPHDMDTVQIFNFFCTTSKLKSEGNIQWHPCSQLLRPVTINCCPSCQRKWFHF